MAHGDGALHRGARDAFARHGEVHVDAGEHPGFDLGAVGLKLDRAAAHIVATALQNQYHVVGGAAARARQQQFQRARRQVQATAFRLGGVRCAVHRQGVAAAGLGDKTHA